MVCCPTGSTNLSIGKFFLFIATQESGDPGENAFPKARVMGQGKSDVSTGKRNAREVAKKNSPTENRELRTATCELSLRHETPAATCSTWSKLTDTRLDTPVSCIVIP